MKFAAQLFTVAALLGATLAAPAGIPSLLSKNLYNIVLEGSLTHPIADSNTIEVRDALTNEVMEGMVR